MNPEYEKQLEARIDRELKELGELPAPRAFASRVLGAIERRAALPWYRRSWQTWPAAWQWTSLAVLLVMFGGLCWGGWELTRSATVTAGAPEVAGRFAGLGVFWRTLNALGSAVSVVVQGLGTGYIAGGVLALFLAYVSCIGLGTVYVRLAMARR